jgi:radical SAM protein with 4Fe4S-binding SPASM domain
MIKYYVKEIKYFHKRKILFMAVIRYLLSETFLKSLVNTNLYKYVYLKIIRKSAKNMKPLYFSFESNNFCNARCIMCPYPQMKRKKTKLEFNLFKKGVNEALKYFKPKQFALSGFGEPLLNDDIIDRIKYIKERSKVPIKFFTNASLLNENVARDLVKVGLDEINISINSSSERNYERIMGLNYKNTVEKIKNLLNEKKIQKSKKPIINISMMKIDENKEEIKEFLMKWTNLVDSVVVREPENWSGLKKTKFRSYFKIAYPCIYPFNTIDVLSNGDVVPCCRDFEGREVFGNIKNNTLLKIWNSKKYKEFRRKHIECKFKELKICRYCDTNIINPFYWW